MTAFSDAAELPGLTTTNQLKLQAARHRGYLAGRERGRGRRRDRHHVALPLPLLVGVGVVLDPR